MTALAWTRVTSVRPSFNSIGEERLRVQGITQHIRFDHGCVIAVREPAITPVDVQQP
jgi:hypothetical protein